VQYANYRENRRHPVSLLSQKRADLSAFNHGEEQREQNAAARKTFEKRWITN
jgi:hypothetical protein